MECKYVCKLEILDPNPTLVALQLTREKIYSRQLRQRITRLVQIIIGSGFLTSTLPLLSSLRSIPIDMISCGKLGHAGWGVSCLH